MYNCKIVVASVVNNELFKETNIKLDNEILKINGVVIASIDFESITKLKESIGTIMRYTIKRRRKLIEIETVVQKVL